MLLADSRDQNVCHLLIGHWNWEFTGAWTRAWKHDNAHNPHIALPADEKRNHRPRFAFCHSLVSIDILPCTNLFFGCHFRKEKN